MPPHTPTQHAQSIDHGRVRVCPHKTVGERDPLPSHHTLCQVFKVYLVDDACSRRHDAEALERIRSPTQKFVSFVIALELDFRILLKRVG